MEVTGTRASAPECTLDHELTDISDRIARGCAQSELIDVIARLERFQRAAVAVQAVAIAAFSDDVPAEAAACGVAVDRQGASVAPQVALARGAGPRKGDRFAGTARALVHEMPHSFRALRTGGIDEWTVTGIARETAFLSLEDRGRVDSALMREFRRPGVSGHKVIGSARALSQELDPAGAVQRMEKAERERSVSFRPAPEGLCWVTALVPVRDGVSCNAALLKAVADARLDPDEDRTPGQVMADVFVERVTGRNPLTEPVAVTVDLVMAEGALLRGGEQPAALLDMGSIPAREARNIVGKRR